MPLFLVSQNSMTALIVAVKGGYTGVVKELLKRNPNVNKTDKDHNTALTIAAKEGHTEIVQDLLDAGTYVNVPDRVRCLTVAAAVADMKYNGNKIQLTFLCLVFSGFSLAEWGNNADRSS